MTETLNGLHGFQAGRSTVHGIFSLNRVLLNQRPPGHSFFRSPAVFGVLLVAEAGLEQAASR